MDIRGENEDPEGIEPSGQSRAWLHAEIFEALAGINEECLELLAAQSMVRTIQPHPMLRELSDLWRTLDAGARRRAATCPYLLVDAGFADAGRWRFSSGHGVSEPEPPRGAPLRAAPFFTVPGANIVIRRVLLFARELARTHNVAARLLLGMPGHCATLIAGCTLRQIDDVADRHPAWLQPRWPTRVKVWREFLTTARSGEGEALELARMHGLQLLAAESRASAP